MAISNRIYVGSLTEPLYYYENDSIMSINTTQCVSLIGQELSIDTLTATVLEDFDETHNIKLFRSSDGKIIECADTSIYAIDVTSAATPSDIINIPEWTPIWYYQENALVGKFYTESIKRLSKAQYQLNCVSAIGRIDRMYHGGGLFEVSTFGTVLAHILASGLHGDGAPVIDYYIDDDVAELTVSGWLPYDTKRNNLYQLIFSHGINIIKNPDGSPRFTFVYTNGNSSVPIEDAEIFQVGNVEYEKPYSGVSIMEHTYSDITTDITPTVLYDNTSTTRIENEEIWFDQAPIIVSTLQATEGLTIVSSTVNSAVLTGNGKLTGIPHTHTTRTVSRVNSTGDKEKTVSVEQCTMVNVLNSENLLNRLFAFYCPPDYIKKISNELVYNDERCGKQYRFSNPYMEQEDALLSKMDLNTTTFNRARCEFYAGYDPVGQAGLYQNCIILDKATFAEDGGTFVVPQEILEMEEPSMRVVMIGGGQGGHSGYNGSDGEECGGHVYVAKDADISAIWYGAEGGDGGYGGFGGEPGRVKAVTINNPSAIYQYTIGDGGEGGEQSLNGSNIGYRGTASTFGQYSTSDQEGSYIPVAGVYNPIYGQFYALHGARGIKGGKGGARKVGSGEDFVWVTDGEDVEMPDGTVYHGGKTGRPLEGVPGLAGCKSTAYGGNGAGAAAGIDRGAHPDMDGKSNQSAGWEIVEEGGEENGI